MLRAPSMKRLTIGHDKIHQRNHSLSETDMTCDDLNIWSRLSFRSDSHADDDDEDSASHTNECCWISQISPLRLLKDRYFPPTGHRQIRHSFQSSGKCRKNADCSCSEQPYDRTSSIVRESIHLKKRDQSARLIRSVPSELQKRALSTYHDPKRQDMRRDCKHQERKKHGSK